MTTSRDTPNAVSTPPPFLKDTQQPMRRIVHTSESLKAVPTEGRGRAIQFPDFFLYCHAVAWLANDSPFTVLIRIS